VRVGHLPAREHTCAAGLYPPANVAAGKKILPVPAPNGYPRVSGLPVPAKTKHINIHISTKKQQFLDYLNKNKQQQLTNHNTI
jgi:hypothetical protein